MARRYGSAADREDQRYDVDRNYGNDYKSFRPPRDPQDGQWRHGDREDGYQGGYQGHRGRGRGQGGHRRGRGGRGRGRGRGQDDGQGDEQRERPPPGLKGREIGMWYASRSKKKTLDRELQNRPSIKMDEAKEQNLSRLLSTIRSGDTSDQSQGRRSRDPSRDRAQRGGSHGARSSYREHSDSWTDSHSQKRVRSNDPSPDPQSHTRPGSAHKAPFVAKGKPERESWEELDDDSEEEPLATSSSTNTAPSESWTPDNPTAMDTLPPDADIFFDDSAVLYDPEELGQSEFMTEFYKNKEANRNSTSRLCGLGEGGCSIQRIPSLDQQLLRQQQDKASTPGRHRDMLNFRKKLPSYNMRDEVLRVVNNNQVTVISGETGCGKTTQVSQFILDDHIKRGDGSLCRIVCTQPRRISAISVAERVAEERGETCGGGSVGYQIRLEARRPREQGSILYCTTGILLKWLVSDASLSTTSHVILDEIHERDILSDFLMVVLRDLTRQRPDLKVVLMSATLNAEMFSQYYGECPMLNIPGFTFPVKEYLLEDIIEMTKYRHDDPPQPQHRPRRLMRNKNQQLMAGPGEREDYLAEIEPHYSRGTVRVLTGTDFNMIDLDLAVCLIEHIVTRKGDGAILVFMPGWEQIKKLLNLLKENRKFNSGAYRIIPLHSLMPTCNQREVFDRPPPGVRKIVIATNIAETSITIDDIVYVIDCGKIKMKNYDAENNITTLEPEWVSHANARQRKGRAGRVQAGECFHMYTRYHDARFEDYQLPEILRTQLEELCLQIKLLKLGMIEPFVQKAMQPPPMESLHSAITNLRNLNALDAREDLTPLGYHLAKMPVDPHTGKMLLFAAMFCCLDPVLTVAASLSFKDAFYIPMGKEQIADKRRCELAEGSQSDHIMLANAYTGWERACSRGNSSQYCYNNFLSVNTLKMLKQMRQQFSQLLADTKFIRCADPKDRDANKNSWNEKLVKAVICAGLYPNVARIKPGQKIKPDSKKPVTLQTLKDHKVRFHPKSVNSQERQFGSSWFIYHLKMKTTNIFLYDCSLVSPYPLLFFGGTVAAKQDHGQDCIVVDDWIIFRAERKIAALVLELRQQLDQLLEEKIRSPGVTEWGAGHREGALMLAILDLITTEEHDANQGEYRY